MHSEHDKKRLQGRHGMVAEALRETAQDPFVRDSSRYGIFWGGDARFGGGVSSSSASLSLRRGLSSALGLRCLCFRLAKAPGREGGPINS